jgi:hypothetical protein
MAGEDVSTGEQLGIVLLSLFILGIGGTLDFLGVMLWLRKIPPNRFIGIKIQSMGGNKGMKPIINENSLFEPHQHQVYLEIQSKRYLII